MLSLHDGGGIYFGAAGHVTVRGNLVEQIVDTGGYGASAYYLDEQAHDCLVQGNVSVGIVRPSQNHMAHRNTIEGNLFLNAGNMRMDFARSDGYVVRDNVLDASGSLELRLALDGAATLENNLFGTGSGATRITLDQYAEVGKQPLSASANRLDRPRIRLLRKRVWEVTGKDGKVRVWDLSRAGPRQGAAEARVMH